MAVNWDLGLKVVMKRPLAWNWVCQGTGLEEKGQAYKEPSAGTEQAHVLRSVCKQRFKKKSWTILDRQFSTCGLRPFDKLLSTKNIDIKIHNSSQIMK